MEFVRELQSQLEGGKISGVKHFDDIVMACGRCVFTRSNDLYDEKIHVSFRVNRREGNSGQSLV